jgi:hypothetical protein
MYKVIFLVLCLFPSYVFAQSEGEWFAKHTNNFTIVGPEKEKIVYLAQNIENIKGWIYSRWGFHNIDFSEKCRVYCVSDALIFQKAFNIQRSGVEVRRKNGKIEENLVWVLGNVTPAECVPPSLTEVCLCELEQRYGVKFGLWSHRGMQILNSTYLHIGESLSYLPVRLRNDEPLYFTKVLLTMTEIDYIKQPQDLRKVFDAESVVLCLFFHNEMGRNRFLEFVGTGSTEANLKRVFDIDSYDSFDVVFKQYLVTVVQNGNKKYFNLKR